MLPILKSSNFSRNLQIPYKSVKCYHYLSDISETTKRFTQGCDTIFHDFNNFADYRNQFQELAEKWYGSVTK